MKKFPIQHFLFFGAAIPNYLPPSEAVKSCKLVIYDIGRLGNHIFQVAVALWLTKDWNLQENRVCMSNVSKKCLLDVQILHLFRKNTLT